MVLLQVDHDEVFGPEQRTPSSGFKARRKITMLISSTARITVKTSAFHLESRIAVRSIQREDKELVQ